MEKSTSFLFMIFVIAFIIYGETGKTNHVLASGFMGIMFMLGVIANVIKKK